jgi:hypothetical protein
MDVTEAMAAFGDGRAATVSISSNQFFYSKIMFHEIYYWVSRHAIALTFQCKKNSARKRSGNTDLNLHMQKPTKEFLQLFSSIDN